MKKKERWTMHWRFALKIREQFTVSAFSLTVWQTLLHTFINVYWNKSGLQIDATNDSRCIPFIYLFNAAKCIVYILTRNYHIAKKNQKNQDNSFNLRFQNWERSTIEKTACKHGQNSSFPFFIILIKHE